MFPFTHGVLASSSAQAVSTDFIIRVKTDNAGTSASNQFTLPLPSAGIYNYDVDWGDGVIENHTTNTSKTHTYPTAGTYTIKISGTFPRILFNNGGDRSKLIETVNLGDVGWTSMERAFYGCNNMTISPTCKGVFTAVSNYQIAWRDCRAITSFPVFDLSGGTTFNSTWRDCRALISFPALDLSEGLDFDLAWDNNFAMSSFATRLFYKMQSGFRIFSGTTLPTADYSDILVTQRANNSNNSVTFHGGNSKYNTAGGTARGELVSIQSWAITDGGAE